MPCSYIIALLFAAESVPSWFPAVVLVHGLGVSSRYMAPLARELSPFYRVFAVDLPGFGRSDTPPRRLGLVETAETLAAWMRTTGLRAATLVGNSYGCQIAVELAARRPRMVQRLVLVGPTTDPAFRTRRQQLARLLLDGLRVLRLGAALLVAALATCIATALILLVAAAVAALAVTLVAAFVALAVFALAGLLGQGGVGSLAGTTAEHALQPSHYAAGSGGCGYGRNRGLDECRCGRCRFLAFFAQMLVPRRMLSRAVAAARCAGFTHAG